MTASCELEQRPITTSANVALACAVACVLALLLCVGGAWTSALFMLLTDGAIALAWLAAAVGIGLTLSRLARVHFESLPLQLACAAAFGLGVESLLILSLGLVGALSRISAVALVGLGLGLFCWIIPTLVIKPKHRTEPSPWAWLWLFAMPGLGIALACALLPPGMLWNGAGVADPHAYDVVSYHFQIPREWFELGRIAPLRHNVFSYFPLGVEMHYLLAMHLRGGPWAGMYVAQLMNVGLVSMSALAVYGVLRELRARHATLGAVAAATTPWMILLAPVGYNESGLLMYGTLAIGLMMIAMRSPTPLRLASLAGVMAGFACGAKPTAVPMVLLAVPVALLVCAFFRPPLPPGEGWGEGACDNESRSSPKPPSPQPSPGGRGGRSRAVLIALVYVLLGAVVYSPWLIRNVVWTGNPVFPEAARTLGRGHFTEEQVERWTRTHARRDDQRPAIARGRAFANQVLLDWRFGFALLPLACIAAVIAWRRAETIYLAVILVILTILWLGFTHLQSRFYVLAILLAAMLIGRLRDARVAWFAAAVVAVAAVIGLVNVYAKLRTNPLLFQFLGLDQLMIMTPMADVTLRDDEHLILLGDARAFLYDVPMSRLQYRTVFDVPPDDWMSGMRVEPGKTLVVIDPEELARFSRTYRNLQPVPDAVMNRTAPYTERR